MKSLVIFAHPNPDSFNRAVLDSVLSELSEMKMEFRVRDLYDMGWNPVLAAEEISMLSSGRVRDDVGREQDHVAWADTLIFIYPIWWNEQPAILKGWLDRVFTQGFAYKSTDWGIEGMLQHKSALIITTSGSTKDNMIESKAIESIKTSMIKNTLGFTGIRMVGYLNLFAVPMVSREEREHMLHEVRAAVREMSGMSRAA